MVTEPNNAQELEINWNLARQFLRKYLAGRLHNFDEFDLDDVIQNATVRLIRAIRREGLQNLEALMTTIAKRTAIDFIRTQRRASVIFKQMGDAVEHVSAASDAHGTLGDPQERVEFVVLEFFRGREGSCLELAKAFFERRRWRLVAQELGLSQDAVRARWSRCISVLRKAIAKDPSFRILADWAAG